MKLNPDEPRPILISTLCHFILHLAELSFPAVALLVVAELIRKENAYDRIGFAFFIFSILFGIMQIAGGFLADKLGPRKTIWIYLFGAGLSLILVGFAQNYLMLCASLGLVGTFLGIYHPAGMSLLSRGTRQYGLSMGIHGMGGNFGLALSPFLASALASLLGWRKGFIALGLIPIAFSFWVLLDRKLELKPENPSRDPGSESETKTRLMFRPILILFLMSILNGMCYRGFTTFLPAYFNQRISPNLIPGFSAVLQAGTFTALVLVLGMFGQFLAGRLADKYSKEKLFVAVFLIAVPFLFSLSLLRGLPLIFSAMIFAFFYFANQPIVNSLLPGYSHEKSWGRIYGWFYFMNFGAGSVMSWIAGSIGEKIALSYIFMVFAGLLFLAGLLGIPLIRFKTRAAEI